MRANRTYFNLMISLIILIFSACEKTEKIEDYPFHKSQLVVNCYFSPDTSFRAFVFKSLSPLDNAPYRILEHPKAYVKILHENTLIDSLIFNSQCRCYQGGGVKPLKNITYNMEAYFPGFPKVQSFSFIPDTVRVLNFNVESQVYQQKYNFDGVKTIDINLENNNLDEGKYLEITPNIFFKDSNLRVPYSFRGLTLIPIESENEYTVINNQIYISNFDKPILKIRFKINTYFFNDDQFRYFRESKVTLSVVNHTKEGFEYIKRYKTQNSIVNDPFSEPIPISNNIINGYGVFSGFRYQMLAQTF
ncbi:MAG: DUF4249 family protein [Bacteroidota bacterium]|nr:DUF4249 family protein [Bacteroidota bacterium]